MSERQTILVVEDDEDLRRLFRTALILAGYDVAEAGDGLEALLRIDQAPPVSPGRRCPGRLEQRVAPVHDHHFASHE